MYKNIIFFLFCLGMEKVAEHINEMQRIHEEYGAIFDHLFRQHQKACKQVREEENERGYGLNRKQGV